MSKYFSDKEIGSVERNSEEITADIWDGIFSVYQDLVKNNKLSGRFPEECQDGQGICGCDRLQLEMRVKSEIPKLDIPIKPSDTEAIYSFESDSGEDEIKTIMPKKYAILDFIEFLYKNIQDPISIGSYHQYYNHYHYRFSNEGDSVDKYINDINIIFERNGIIFYSSTNGKIKRKIHKSMKKTIKKTKHWLDQYPNALKYYSQAVEKYENGKYPRNLLDDLRVSLEILLKELLNNSSSLENQIKHIGNYMKPKGGSKELINMFKKLLDYYTSYQNNYVKHSSSGSIKEEEVEFIIELTSSFMKHLIKVKS